MNRRPRCGVPTCLTVILVGLSCLVILPSENEGQGPIAHNIYIPVLSDGSPVPDAWVNLTEVHTGAITTASYSVTLSAYVVNEPASGYYRVSVEDPDYYDALGERELSFDGRDNVTVTPIELTALPDKTLSIDMTVVDSGAAPISGAYVSVYDNTAREFVSHAATTTNISGKTAISMFNTNLIPGHTFYMVARKAVFEMNATAVALTASSSMTMELVPSKRVSGFITDANGPAPGTVAYLISKDTSIPWVKRVMRSLGAAMVFDAYSGDFVLVVDAEGDAAYTRELTVTASTVLSIPLLAPQTQLFVNRTIVFGADFTGFVLDVNGSWPHDQAHPGLMYGDLGCLRMQVDLVLGNGDGVLDVAEVTSFVMTTYNWGTEFVATDSLLLLNDSLYYGGSLAGYQFQLSEGSVHTSDPVHFAYSCDYEAPPGEIDVGESDYDATIYAMNDTAALDNVYMLTLPTGYELVANNSQYTDVCGYLTVTLDPPEGSTIREQIALVIEAWEVPCVSGAVVITPGVAYAELDGNGSVIRYLLRVWSNITFTSAGSMDPNGNPLTFAWEFDDGSPTTVTADESCVHMFLNPSTLRSVTLNVTDVAGLYNTTEIAAACDGMRPRPAISVSGGIIDIANGSVTVNQGGFLTVNATSSVDDTALVGDGDGILDNVEFYWGDGNTTGTIPWNSEQQNRTHAYERAGVYLLTLNATDVTGHWKNTSMQVIVLDITPPTPVAVITPSPAMAGETVWFNASQSTDADGSIETYVWTFLDDGVPVTLVGVNVSYVFAGEPQTVTVVLNCTDSSGNWATTSTVLDIAGIIPEFPSSMVVVIGIVSLLVALRSRPRLRRH